MRLTVRLVFQPIWTDNIHDEWIRNVLADRPGVSRRQLERARLLMETYGRDWQAPDYERLIPSLTLPDKDDRHVLAAAIAGKASIIVTYNLDDFPLSVLATYGVEALHPDPFLSQLFDQDPELFMMAIRDLLAGLRNPPRTLEQQLEVLHHRGLKATAQRILMRSTSVDTDLPE
jgi:hypothetical protein